MSLPTQPLHDSVGVAFWAQPNRGHGGAAARCSRPPFLSDPAPHPVTTATPPRPSRHIARRAQAPPPQRSDWSAAIAPSRHSVADWPAPLRHGRAVPAGRWRPLLISMAAGRPSRGPPPPFAPIALCSLPHPPFLPRGAAGRRSRVKEGDSGTASSLREAAAGCPGAGR